MLSIHHCSYEVGSCHGESGVAIINVPFRRLRTRLACGKIEEGETWHLRYVSLVSAAGGTPNRPI